jgi:transcriptional regulator with XRE-family HTH domain
MRDFNAALKPQHGTTFGTMLKQWREERGLSQSALAQRADIDHTTISRIESGQRYPSYSMVMRLADALGLTGPIRARMIVEAFIPHYYREDVRDVLNAMQPVEVAS